MRIAELLAVQLLRDAMPGMALSVCSKQIASKPSCHARLFLFDA